MAFVTSVVEHWLEWEMRECSYHRSTCEKCVMHATNIIWYRNEDMREREMFYLMTHPTHFIYGYNASDIWLRTILIVRKETRCCHIGYSYRLTARVILYAPSHRQDNTYHGLCYTSRGALAGTRNSSMGPPHEGSIRRPIALWANALTTELHVKNVSCMRQISFDIVMKMMCSGKVILNFELWLKPLTFF